MKKLIVLSCMVFAGATSFAQTNFSGTWTLSSKEHIDGPQYANALTESYTLTQRADSLILVTPNGRSAYAMNGGLATVTSAASNRKSVRSLVWSADKKSVTLTNAIYAEGDPNTLELTRVQTWTLSDDGKNLNVDLKSIETKSENWSVKGVYAKQ